MSFQLPVALSDGETAQRDRRAPRDLPGAELSEIDYADALDRAGRLPAGRFPPRDNVECVAVDKISRTPDIVELRLRPIGPVLRYRPGQYVEVHGPDAEEGAYSIANAPRRDGEIALLVSRARG